jgi:hypothetical protein
MENKVKNDLLGVMRALNVLPCAKPFSKPVDVIGLNIPDYLEIIQKPMDLGTIKKKLMGKEYLTQDEFLEDVYLIFENCRKYNTDPRNPVRMLCEDLQTQFEIQWNMYQDRKKFDGEKPKVEEKIPIKRAVETIEVKKVRRAKLKEEEKIVEVEMEKEKIKEELERKKEEKEKIKAEREKMKEEKERIREEKAREERQKEIEREIERKKNEAEIKVKEKVRRKVEIEYQEVLNFDKLTGKDDFQNVVKIKVPEIIEKPEPVVEEVKQHTKVESIEYMRAALTPLVDFQSRSLLKMNLLNAIFTVSLLKK